MSAQLSRAAEGIYRAVDLTFTLLQRRARGVNDVIVGNKCCDGRRHDLVPAPGSPAEKREQWIRDHPRLLALRATLGGTAGIVVPLVLAWLLAGFAFSIDLPGIPLPDLPSIPLPDLPEIPWPDWSLPDWSLPGWVREVLDVLKLVFPVLPAFVLARAEVKRRRKQDELRTRRRAGLRPHRDPACVLRTRVRCGH